MCGLCKYRISHGKCNNLKSYGPIGNGTKTSRLCCRCCAGVCGVDFVSLTFKRHTAIKITETELLRILFI